MEDYYAVLGVAPTAEDVVLEAARKALLVKYHPDRNEGAVAVARCRAINESFQVLNDPTRRAAYDRARASLRERQRVGPMPRPHGSLAPVRPPARALRGSLLLWVGLIVLACAALSYRDDRGRGLLDVDPYGATLERLCR